MKFKFTFETRLEDTNNKFNITNKSLLTMMENCTERHQSSLGYGLKDIINTGLTWVIVDWQLKVIKRPKYGDTIEVNTWVSHIENIYSYKDFEIYVNGSLCAIATSKWVLLDIKNKTIVEVPKELKSKSLQNNIPKVFEEESKKLHILDSYSNEFPINIRKSDIDLNNHVHNLNYLDFINETLDINEKEYDNLRIIYRKEIKSNSNIFVKKEIIDNIIHFLIIDKDETIYSIIEMF